MSQTLRIVFLTVIATICAAASHTATAAPHAIEPLPTDKPSAGAAQVFAANAGTLENEFVGIAVNGQGQFVIYTTGGDPNVEGDEGKLLMYPRATSFTTIRDKLANAVNWKHTLTYDAVLREQKIVDHCSDASLGNQCYIETFYHLGCQRFARQELSFMTNPFTGRKDMVRIAYDFKQRSGGCTDTFLDDTLVSTRIVIDTQIGNNDYAPFFLPGVGNSNLEATFSGETIPPYFRVFEDPTYDPGSLQAIGILDIGGDAVNRPLPSRFQIASWAGIVATEWDYETTEDMPHGDSAIAAYWDPYREPWLTTFQFGYGLAPQGGGNTWVDAPAVVNDGTIFDSYSWVYNSTNDTYTGGQARIIVTANIGVRPTVSAASSGTEIQQIGDVAPGATAQVKWPLEIIGGPGTYTYTTITEFTSGQIFTSVHAVTLQQGVKFSETNFTVDENAGAITVTVKRTNAGGDQVTVNASATGGTASAGQDFAPISTTLAFDGVTTQQTFTIDIPDDDVFEGTETILLTLNDPSPNASIVDQGRVVVTIVDNEYDPAFALTTIPGQLDFAIENRTSPLTQTMSITGAQIAWTAAASEPWLALSSAEGVGAGAVDVAVDIANLLAGSHSAEITVHNVASGQRTTIPVNLTVGAAQLNVSPSKLEAPATTGNANPDPMLLTIENTNVGRMDWTATESIPWLSLSTNSGTAPSLVEVAFDLAALAPGTHSGEIAVNASDQTSTVTVSVTAPESVTPGSLYLPVVTP